eukprot:CAMPEP_0174922596 /NCGR_PEP_ID=MMETSP1355-20121228/5984_1 /TAXON_ID=464990 /ORGANISM="Hemiselmis tepida, Strain CCMP443" /LENGTH=53 /DNA_ID=CAMNT_0016168203 /DNA_START=627 /DNA_END=788 /DNA_ORIENTATION=-
MCKMALSRRPTAGANGTGHAEAGDRTSIISMAGQPMFNHSVDEFFAEFGKGLG